MFSLKNNAENDAGRLDSELFLFLIKVLYEVKVSGLQLSFNIYIYISPSNWHTIKSNCISLWNIDLEIWSILFP